MSEKKKIDFKSLRESMGYDLSTAASVFGVTERTLRRWENGEVETPKYAILLLKYIKQYGLM